MVLKVLFSNDNLVTEKIKQKEEFIYFSLKNASKDLEVASIKDLFSSKEINLQINDDEIAITTKDVSLKYIKL